MRLLGLPRLLLRTGDSTAACSSAQLVLLAFMLVRLLHMTHRAAPPWLVNGDHGLVHRRAPTLAALGCKALRC